MLAASAPSRAVLPRASAGEPSSSHRAANAAAGAAHQRQRDSLRRREILGASVFGVSLSPGSFAQAVAPDAVSKTWGAITGAQPDLFFPDSFLGDWDVIATLKSVETPLGSEYVQDSRVVESARLGIGKPVQYPQRFIRNGSGRVVPDRAFNTVRLVEAMSGTGAVDTSDWDPEDPNVLRLKLSGARGVFIRVTARRQEEPEPSRIVTSEVVEQVLDAADGVPGPPRLRRSRCVTKYKFRTAAEAAAAGGGPQIIANQVVYDYADMMGDIETQMEALGKPTVVYTYGLVFFRPSLK